MKTFAEGYAIGFELGKECKDVAERLGLNEREMITTFIGLAYAIAIDSNNEPLFRQYVNVEKFLDTLKQSN